MIWDKLIKFATIKILHIPIVESFWAAEVFDNSGNLIKKIKPQRSKSWNRNAYNLLFATLAAANVSDTSWGAGNLNIRDTGGTTRSFPTRTLVLAVADYEALNSSYGFISAAGVTTRGIILGSSSTTESFDHHYLQSLIGHGTGSGQLQYGATEAAIRTWDASNRIFRRIITRYFTNGSGATVTVREAGLCHGTITIGGSTYDFMLSRDVLPSAIEVPNNGVLKFQYIIALTYPA